MNLTQKQSKIIETFGFENAVSFLENYPYRYDFIEATNPTEWIPKDTVAFEGKLVQGFKVVRFGRNQSLTRFNIYAYEQEFQCIAFNRQYLRQYDYKDGIAVTGVIDDKGVINVKTITNKPLSEITGIKPIYALKSGVKNYEVERLIHKILKEVCVDTVLPSNMVKKYDLLTFNEALRNVHKPETKELLFKALTTLKYQEFLIYHISIALNNTTRELGISKNYDADLIKVSISSLPYELTPDQVKALEEILSDLKSSKQMNRLLQGDVGSGKTIVTMLAMAACINAGYQVAFMVPTEILLQQHARSFKKLFPSIRLSVLSQATKDKHTIIQQLAEGTIQCVIGTHTLFQDDVIFKKLGFVIIDEQHRFGVNQRQALVKKGDSCDVLMLSATPIPRTLASSLYFDLDVSSIETYPSNRRLTETFLVKENSLRTFIDEIYLRLKHKEQIYIVCPAIEDDGRSGVKNVRDITKHLSSFFKDYSVDYIHSKRSSEDKERVMNSFIHGSIDILISTTVVEVGVDVPNANLMIIYNADLYGLATLHQLRGRVGRAGGQGQCYLLTSTTSEEGLDRLNALVSSQDGFKLSMIDMRQRGFGDVLGNRQSGVPQFILGDILEDELLLKSAKEDASLIVKNRNDDLYTNIFEEVSKRDYFRTI